MFVGGAGLLIALIILIIVLIYDKEEGLVYVFEIVRHGARAPVNDDSGFKVQTGMLTAMGMR